MAAESFLDLVVPQAVRQNMRDVHPEASEPLTDEIHQPISDDVVELFRGRHVPTFSRVGFSPTAFNNSFNGTSESVSKSESESVSASISVSDLIVEGL